MGGGEEERGRKEREKRGLREEGGKRDKVCIKMLQSLLKIKR